MEVLIGKSESVESEMGGFLLEGTEAEIILEVQPEEQALSEVGLHRC